MVSMSQNAAQEPFFHTTGPDLRADCGRRNVAISAERVTITRQLQGIDMCLSLAVSAYVGVALCLRPGPSSALMYQIRLVHRDQDLSVVLDEAPDDRNILADWRLWARVLNLPALVERSLGQFEPALLTPAQAGARRSCMRRHRSLKRRPRFLARRRMGRSDGGLVVHTGEREIIART